MRAEERQPLTGAGSTHQVEARNASAKSDPAKRRDVAPATETALG